MSLCSTLILSEEYCQRLYQPDVLNLLSGHWSTSEPLSPEIVEKLCNVAIKQHLAGYHLCEELFKWGAVSLLKFFFSFLILSFVFQCSLWYWILRWRFWKGILQGHSFTFTTKLFTLTQSSSGTTRIFHIPYFLDAQKYCSRMSFHYISKKWSQGIKQPQFSAQLGIFSYIHSNWHLENENSSFMYLTFLGHQCLQPTASQLFKKLCLEINHFSTKKK